MKLEGNTILITGGTSGIGRGLAEAFHKLGNKVIIAGRRQNLIDQITAANPGMEGLQLDVQDAAAVSKFTENVAKKYPQLNVLINNAGIAKFESWSDDKVDLNTVRAIIQTNITSVIQLTAELLPLLRKQKNATMITTTSGLAFVPLTAAPTYSASKAFLHSWLQSVRSQLNG
ncbi:MAG TPA: SDR family NAD(P)-dependent oxidoreductase, partial [Candidatus Melainabacteria bacterium]|nr:SDR family NAD(P)-dependent oxidoreductase [Candidatus Melainabacteria bacterium]